MRKLLVFSLMVPGLLIVLGLLGISAVVLSQFPAPVTWTASAVFAVVLAWFIFGRRRAAGPGFNSETAMIGRQSSKDGLL